MMKRYLCASVFALVLSLGYSNRANAQSTPSGQTANTENYPENRTNYNYLGLLGLLGLYGLHKNRVAGGTVVDRKVS